MSKKKPAAAKSRAVPLKQSRPTVSSKPASRKPSNAQVRKNIATLRERMHGKPKPVKLSKIAASSAVGVDGVVTTDTPASAEFIAKAETAESLADPDILAQAASEDAPVNHAGLVADSDGAILPPWLELFGLDGLEYLRVAPVDRDTLNKLNLHPESLHFRYARRYLSRQLAKMVARAAAAQSFTAADLEAATQRGYSMGMEAGATAAGARMSPADALLADAFDALLAAEEDEAARQADADRACEAVNTAVAARTAAVGARNAAEIQTGVAVGELRRALALLRPGQLVEHKGRRFSGDADRLRIFDLDGRDVSPVNPEIPF